MSHSGSSPPVWTIPLQNSSVYGTVPSYHMPVKFNPTMGIIIGIVFTAFFIMGFLSVYVRRCIARRTHYQVGDVTMPMPMGSTVVGFPAQLESQGLDKETIQSLPIVQFSSERCLKQGKYSMECSVCLTEFEDNEVLRSLPGCGHSFHPDCIDMWLSSHSTCPLCRSILIPFKFCSDLHNLQARTNSLLSQRSRSFQDVSITIMEEEATSAEESQQSPSELVWDVEAQHNVAESMGQRLLTGKEDSALIPNSSSMPKAASHNHLHRSRSGPAQSLVWEREQLLQGFSNHGNAIEESSVRNCLRRALSSEFR